MVPETTQSYEPSPGPLSLDSESSPFSLPRPPPKRVRIHSPVLVVETPARPRHKPSSLVHLPDQPDPDEDADVGDVSRVIIDPDPDPDQSEEIQDDSVDIQGSSDGDERVSAPQTRPAVCRFSFFTKARPSAEGAVELLPAQSPAESPLPRSDASTTFTTTAGVSVSVSRSIDVLDALNPMAGMQQPDTTVAKRHPNVDRIRRLEVPSGNTSNDGSRISTESRSISFGGESIPPPPTLHFALGSVTALARILSSPLGFANQSHGGPAARSNKANLLVVIKEMGEMSLASVKYPVDNAPDPRGRSERRELVVMDGRPNSRIGLPGERYLFRVVLWGRLARDWTGESDESIEYGQLAGSSTGRFAGESQDASSSSSSSSSMHGVRVGDGYSCESVAVNSTEPTALRVGDVVYLHNVSLVKSVSTAPTGGGMRRSRLGAGFPPRAPTGDTHLVGHISERNKSSVELCYRSLAMSAMDHRRNFDPDVAQFDNKSRKVWDLRTLWLQSVGR